MSESYLLKSANTEEELIECLKMNKYIIIKASAKWCKPCKIIEEPVKALFKNILDKSVKVMNLDIDECDEDVLSYLNITKIPAFYSFINGKLDNGEITSEIKDIENIIEKMNSHSILG